MKAMAGAAAVAVTNVVKSVVDGKTATSKSLVQLTAEEVATLLRPSSGNRLGSDLSRKNRAHIEELKQSMRDRGFLIDRPIVIRGDGEIISGHHRYQATLELEIPVWVEINDSATVADFALVDGINKKWTTMDWIRKYAAEGNAEYVRVLDFFEKTQLKLNVGLILLFGTSSTPAKTVHNSIARGTLKVPNVDVDRAWKRLMAIELIGKSAFPQHPDLCRGDHIFVSAIMHCINNVPGYDNCKMAERASRQTERIRLQRTRKETARMLADVYNYGVPAAKHLKFDGVPTKALRLVASKVA